MSCAREVCPGFTVRTEYRQLFHDIVLWCLGIKGNLHITKGLWLWGDIGTGKSTLIDILSRFWPLVSGSRYTFRVSNVTDICGQYQADGYEALRTFIDWRIQAFDELGSEAIPTAHYHDRENVMQYILQRRYERRSKSLTFVTTNLAPDQISEYYDARIFDRCKEMFNLIPLRGATFRQW